MKEYEITLPIVGMAFLTIEAESADEALNMAMDEAGPDYVNEWMAYDKIVEGNVCYVSPSKAIVREIASDSDE